VKPSRRARAAQRALHDQLGAIYAEPSGLFHKLVEAAGLAPQRDFHDRDLQDIRFTGADVRGFDFSRSDLRGTRLRYVSQINLTTVLNDAIIDQDDYDWLLSNSEPAAAAAAAAPTRPAPPAATVDTLASSRKLLRLPIRITDGNGYMLPLLIGSQATRVNILLDTASSMLAVNAEAYDPGADGSATTTDLLQSHLQTESSLLAAVVQTPVGPEAGGTASVTVPKANLGVIYRVRPGMFGTADGKLGLAYPALNTATRMPGNTSETR
jgi:hypothetical protein